MKHKQNAATCCAILAAAFYALNAPFSKLLLAHVQPAILAGLLYIGAGVGLLPFGILQKKSAMSQRELPLTKADLPYTLGMVLLDIAAPVLLMFGLTSTDAANASLLNNFEIVATALIALLLFREKISKRLWIAILLVTLSSLLLSVEDTSSFRFSFGSLFVLLACVCWGLENNCTKMLSTKNPLHIVVIKGLSSGVGSLLIGLSMGEALPALFYTSMALLLGFFAYGLSIFFYIYAQRELGAAKTSTYYAIAPFLGMALSFLLFWQPPDGKFLIALLIMILGTYVAATDAPDTK